MSDRCEKRSSSPLSSIGTLRICLTLLSSRPSVVLSGANLYAHKKNFTTEFRTLWPTSKLFISFSFSFPAPRTCVSFGVLLSFDLFAWELAHWLRTFKKPLHKLTAWIILQLRAHNRKISYLESNLVPRRFSLALHLHIPYIFPIPILHML